jgi:hypothetical protein
MDTSDAIQSSSAPAASISGTKAFIVSTSSAYSDATNAWNYLQKIGGGCCNNCKKLCGFAIKLSGTNNYLTNQGSFLNFQSVATPSLSNQIFTFSQNADCTWAISIGNKYLSTTVVFLGQWVSLSNSIGVN